MGWDQVWRMSHDTTKLGWRYLKCGRWDNRQRHYIKRENFGSRMLSVIEKLLTQVGPRNNFAGDTRPKAASFGFRWPGVGNLRACWPTR
jgi:hypothetical protein